MGPNTRIEFKRDAGDGYVAVELPRAEHAQLRERLVLRPDSQVHLKARRLTRFAAPEPAAR